MNAMVWLCGHVKKALCDLRGSIREIDGTQSRNPGKEMANSALPKSSGGSECACHEGKPTKLSCNPAVSSVAKRLMEDTSSFDQLLAKARDRSLTSYKSITRHHFGQLRAFDLYRWHYTDREIAECLGVSQQTAKKWREDVCMRYNRKLWIG